MAEHQPKDKSSGPMIVTGLVMILLFSGFVIFLISEGESIPNVEDVHAQARLKNLADLNAENQKILTQYRWVDKGKGVVGVPIDRAMDQVLAELQSVKPHPAGPVSTPAPPSPTPQSSPAPAPQGSPSPSPNAPKPGGQP
jgi:hypothetical protein